MAMVRSFVAIEVPSRIKEEIRPDYDLLRAYFRGGDKGAIKWVPPENWHITLKFLGEIPESALKKSEEILGSCSTQFSRFRMRLRRVGCFPSPKRPRVLWAGIEEEGSHLSSISACLEDAFQKIGVAREERVFHAHLTFGRIKKGSSRIGQALVECLQMRLESSWFEVQDLHFYKSVLTPKGPTYSLIFKAPLADR